MEFSLIQAPTDKFLLSAGLLIGLRGNWRLDVCMVEYGVEGDVKVVFCCLCVTVMRLVRGVLRLEGMRGAEGGLGGGEGLLDESEPGDVWYFGKLLTVEKSFKYNHSKVRP